MTPKTSSASDDYRARGDDPQMALLQDLEEVQ